MLLCVCQYEEVLPPSVVDVLRLSNYSHSRREVRQGRKPLSLPLVGGSLMVSLCLWWWCGVCCAQLLRMERCVLEGLGFSLLLPTPRDFIDW